jgi:hypothetical protein
MSSEEEQEFQYVFIESGCSATNENNLLASPVEMSTGEANFVNEFLESANSTQRYILIEQEK